MDEGPVGGYPLVKRTIYLEGGGDAKDLHARCREGFRKLLEACGFRGRMPRLVACGGRGTTFDDFRTEHLRKAANDFVAMLIDSEDPMDDINAAWDHLRLRDGWNQPAGATDDQVLLMTTCMETWIVADRATLDDHYGNCLQQGALPALNDLESRSRQDVQQQLSHATRNCARRYAKGSDSFVILGKLLPDNLEMHLPSFRRVRQILDNNL